MKSILFLSTFLFFFSCSVIAQNIKQFDYGVAFSANLQSLNVKTSDWSANGINKQLKSIEVTNELGFEIAVICQYNINKTWSLRSLPAFSFQSSRLHYYFNNDSKYFRGLETVEANLPFHLTYTLASEKHIAPSFSVGGFVSKMLPPKSRSNRYWKYDAGLEAGMSLKMKTRKFIVAPELLYSMGLKNLNKLDNTIYTNAIQKLTRNRFILRVSFYG